MWTIEEHRRVDKQLSGSVPIEILKRYEKWKDIARLSGPAGLRAIKGFHDEALSGQWKGFRSSAYSYSGRIIYQVLETKIIVKVVQITPDHNYKI